MRKLILVLFIFCLYHSLQTHIGTFRLKTSAIDEIRSIIPGMQQELDACQGRVLYMSNNTGRGLFFQTQFAFAPYTLINSNEQACSDCPLVLWVRDKRPSEELAERAPMDQNWQMIRSGSNGSFDITLFKKR